jgi:hypothetical protein
VVPYKLLHAVALAELGLLPQAAAYFASITATLQSLGKLPPGLLVCRAAAADLKEQLQQYAAGHKMSLQHGSFTAGALVSNVGKWLDRGLSALMGAAAGGGGANSDAASRPASNSGDGLADSRSCHRRNGSSGSQPTALSRNASATSLGLQGEQHVPSPPQHHKGGMLGFLGKVSSIGSFSKLVAPATGAAGERQKEVGGAPVPFEQENVFYYDQELKMWRERGMESTLSQSQEPGPPPTALVWQQEQQPHHPQADGSWSGAQPANVGARYVNSFDVAAPALIQGVGGGRLLPTFDGVSPASAVASGSFNAGAGPGANGAAPLNRPGQQQEQQWGGQQQAQVWTQGEQGASQKLHLLAAGSPSR